MADMEYFVPMVKSTQLSGNGFEANLKYVDDNTAYFKNILSRFNRDILGNIERLSDWTIALPKLTNEMMQVCVPKYLYGNIHEPHSYLLEYVW